MYVYIFQKGQRTPYLDYLFLNNAVVLFPIENLSWSICQKEQPIEQFFVHQWIAYLETNKSKFFIGTTEQFQFIYNKNIEDLKEILEFFEFDFEVYIQR